MFVSRFEIRDSESFEGILMSARDTELLGGHLAANNELHQAISNLSRRSTLILQGQWLHWSVSPDSSPVIIKQLLVRS